MKLSELLEVNNEQCSKCISYTYTLTHKIDKELCIILRVFGKELYPIDVIDLFKIEEPGLFYIECIVGSKYLKVWFKKSLGNEIQNKLLKLEDCLIEWFSDKFNSEIERDNNE